MPVATRSQQTHKFKLESLPEGWIELRKMSFGEVTERQNAVSNVTAPMGGRDGAPRDVHFNTQVFDAMLYDFKRAVVDHNLEDERGKKLDLSNPQDVRNLDPAVGVEISALIDHLNDGDDIGPFLWNISESPNGASGSSKDALPRAAEPLS